MSVGVVLLIAVGVFVLMLAAQMPVALALTTSGLVGLLLSRGVVQAAGTLESAAYQATATYSLVVIPMFILMGVLVANAGVLRDLFSLANRATRHIPGGLGIATVLAAAGFSAVTGSSASAVATLGRLCVGEMRKHGYHLRMAAGIVAASGTLGVLIPPSVVLVIYGVLAQESIGQLLLAAIIPGALTAVAYIVTIMLIVTFSRNRPQQRQEAKQLAAVGGGASDGSVGGGSGGWAAPGSEPAVPQSNRLREYEAFGYIFVIFVIVLGGIYTGVFTETEAGAVGALAALMVLLLRSRRTEQGLVRSFTGALRETSSVTGMTFALLIGGSVFTLFLVTERVPVMLTDWVVGLDVAGWVVILVFLLVLLILGALLDGVSILLLTIPLAYPVVISLDYSGVWFGVIAVKMIEIGLLTPPFGLNAYVVAGVADDVKVEDAFRGVAPFIVAELCVVALLFVFPDLVTWLPDLVRD